MDKELSRLYRLFFHRLFHQLTGKGGKFPVRHHPSHHIAAEDIENDIEVVIGPLCRSLKFGNIPRPDFIRGPCKNLRFGIPRTDQLISSLFQFPLFFKDPVHRADRAEIPLFIKKGCIDLPGRLIDKTVFMEDIKHFTSFRRR